LRRALTKDAPGLFSQVSPGLYVFRGLPPPLGSYGIRDLGGRSFKVFEFKRLAAKVFEKQ
jgi:hypothetical protein